ncbi:hypothetical protein [Alcaligenes sp. 13f]|uniref:oxidoreductase n=1 Tax=Alcaligenes sp. 13f TaxID=2841924 RepID=UPI001CF69FBB|nr:hypothetical protein [Alcaligenes sp. 13f]
MAPAILMTGFRFSSFGLGLFFASTVIVVFGAGFLAPRLVHQWGQVRTARIGLLIALVGSTVLLVGKENFLFFAVALTVFLLGIGMANPLGTDDYGGSIENRSRIVLEVAQAVSNVFGADRVGIRLSPFGVANGSGEDEPLPLYSHLITHLARLNLAYLHLIEPHASGAGQAEVDHQNVPFASELFRPLWPTVLIAAGNYTPVTATAAINAGRADAIAFGRLFIANPDLPERVRTDATLNKYVRATFYGGGAEGYTDYPRLSSSPQTC